jgi:hypothetical protein
MLAIILEWLPYALFFIKSFSSFFEMKHPFSQSQKTQATASFPKSKKYKTKKLKIRGETKTSNSSNQ